MKFAVAVFCPLCCWSVSATRLIRGAKFIDGCGAKPTFAHSEPADYKDAREQAYNMETKKMEPVTFASGTVISFKCRPGYTTDGSKDGVNTFDVDCTEGGYFKPHGVCMKASKCGAVPHIDHAAPTGKVNDGKTEFACANGYSLDGEKVIAGGMGKNRFFEMMCVEFSGAFEKFEGECKPYAFVPAGETIRIYNQVSEALFIVSCKGTLKTSFAKGETPSMDSVCAKFGEQSAACESLVTTIKGDFEKELKAREDADKEEKKDWYEAKSDDRPGIGDEADTFCTELWGLLEMPN